jgi:hypothetical protein
MTTTATTAATAAAARPAPGFLGRVPGWIAGGQRELSDRAHADGDAFCAWADLTVTQSTGRYGFSARTYRHPGFDRR